MTLTNAESLLVAILAAFLALFLLLAIIATIKIIQVLNHLKSISEKAEKLADTAEHVGEFFRYSAGPVAIAKLFAGINEHVFKKSPRGKRTKDES